MDLSIILCTKNRPLDLGKCVKSIINADKPLVFQFVEIMIIDDGELDKNFINELEIQVSKQYLFTYYTKTKNPGLFYSRIKGSELAKGDIILFLDDDTEIDRNYILELEKTYQNHPQCVGAGGIDINFIVTGLYKLYFRLFLLSAGKPGSISISGHCGSMLRWAEQREYFKTKFLLGFNMSFKKQILNNIDVVDWFDGYSAFEDIYISHAASRHGDLIMNPLLKLVHHQSKASRESIWKTKYSYVLNNYRFLRYFHFPVYTRIFYFYSRLGLILLNILRYNKYGPLKGHIDGIKSVLKLILIKK
jgi:glycosyltransferase involved in cell wall biosynthesis